MYLYMNGIRIRINGKIGNAGYCGNKAGFICFNIVIKMY